jgi:hypothetical protein
MMLAMRTTVTLDPDNERIVRHLMRERGISFKQALNEAIRAGQARNQQSAARQFTQKTFALGAEQYFRWDKALAVADAMEDEELARKLSIQK